MKDLQIVPADTGDVSFEIRGVTTDEGIQILQQLYIMLFSSTESGSFRESAGDLSVLLSGMNIPATGIVDSILAIACRDAVSALDYEDRIKIYSLQGTYTGESIILTLTLANGVTIRGVLKNE